VRPLLRAAGACRRREEPVRQDHGQPRPPADADAEQHLPHRHAWHGLRRSPRPTAAPSTTSPRAYAASSRRTAPRRSSIGAGGPMPYDMSRRFMNLLGSPNWTSPLLMCVGTTACVNGELGLHRAAADQRRRGALLPHSQGADHPRPRLPHGGRAARRRGGVRRPLQRALAARVERLPQPLSDPGGVVRSAWHGGRRVRQICGQESASVSHTTRTRNSATHRPSEARCTRGSDEGGRRRTHVD